MGWGAFVDLIEHMIVTTGAALGDGIALGIVVFTLVVRLALIPIMLPLAVRTRDRNVVVKRIRPEMRMIQHEFRKDPETVNRALKELHERNGIGLVDYSGLLAAFIQLPLLIALFQAVYHVSENTPLASGGLVVGLAASALSVLGVWLGGQADSRPMLVIALVLPVVVATWLGMGIGLYLVAFYAGSAVQATLMRRRPVRTPVPVQT